MVCHSFGMTAAQSDKKQERERKKQRDQNEKKERECGVVKCFATAALYSIYLFLFIFFKRSDDICTASQASQPVEKARAREYTSK